LPQEGDVADAEDRGCGPRLPLPQARGRPRLAICECELAGREEHHVDPRTLRGVGGYRAPAADGLVVGVRCDDYDRHAASSTTRSYTSRYPSAMRRALKRSSARSRTRVRSSVRQRSTACRSVTAPRSKAPVTPSSTISGTAPTARPATGVPESMLSTITSPNGSGAWSG